MSAISPENSLVNWSAIATPVAAPAAIYRSGDAVSANISDLGVSGVNNLLFIHCVNLVSLLATHLVSLIVSTCASRYVSTLGFSNSRNLISLPCCDATRDVDAHLFAVSEYVHKNLSQGKQRYVR